MIVAAVGRVLPGRIHYNWLKGDWILPVSQLFPRFLLKRAFCPRRPHFPGFHLLTRRQFFAIIITLNVNDNGNVSGNDSGVIQPFNFYMKTSPFAPPVEKNHPLPVLSASESFSRDFRVPHQAVACAMGNKLPDPPAHTLSSSKQTFPGTCFVRPPSIQINKGEQK